MKLSNILSLLFFFVVAVSCSMEDDVLNDMSNENIPTTAENTAYLSFNLNMGEAQTKSSSVTENPDSAAGTMKEVDITSVVFFLLDKNGDVLGVGNGKEAKILTKVKEGMTVLAVANCSNAEISKLSNRDVILATSLNAQDLTNLVKVGESGVIVFEDNFGDKSTAYAPEKEKKVTINVSQVAACVELNKLSFVYKANEKQYDVKLTGVGLENQNAIGILTRNFVEGGYKDVTISKDQILSAAGTFDKAPAKFYTFANEASASTTKLVLSFEVNGEKVIKKYSIKTPKNVGIGYDEIVKSGYLYRLTVTSEISSGVIDCKISCTVSDWLKNKIDLGVIDAN